MNCCSETVSLYTTAFAHWRHNSLHWCTYCSFMVCIPKMTSAPGVLSSEADTCSAFSNAEPPEPLTPASLFAPREQWENKKLRLCCLVWKFRYCGANSQEHFMPEFVYSHGSCGTSGVWWWKSTWILFWNNLQPLHFALSVLQTAEQLTHKLPAWRSACAAWGHGGGAGWGAGQEPARCSRKPGLTPGVAGAGGRFAVAR